MRAPHWGSGSLSRIDITFLKENRNQLRGIFLTHGHEDHAGAVSFIINELPLPVYGSRLTLGLVSARLQERKLLDRANLIEIRAREKLKVGGLTIEPLNVTHSYPDSFCFVISTGRDYCLVRRLQVRSDSERWQVLGPAPPGCLR